MTNQKQVRKVLDFMLEYQAKSLSGIPFGVSKLCEEHKVSTSTPSVMYKAGLLTKKHGYLEVPNLTFTEKDAKTFIDFRSEDVKKRNDKRKDKREEAKLNPEINKYSISRLQESKTLLQNIIDESSDGFINRDVLESLFTNFNSTVGIKACIKLGFIIPTQLGIVYVTKIAIASLIVARKFLDTYAEIHSSEEVTTEPLDIFKEEVKEESIQPSSIGYSAVDSTVPIKERKYTIEEARGIYKFAPILRDNELKDYTNEELGIDTFPKTYEEVENRLEDLDPECWGDERNINDIKYPTKKDMLAADAECKLKWIAYYCNLRSKESELCYIVYRGVNNSGLYTTSILRNYNTSNTILFNSEEDLEKSLFHYRELWDAYFKL